MERSKDTYIPLVVEIMDLTIDMLSAGARRSYMENALIKLISSKLLVINTVENQALQAKCDKYEKALKEISTLQISSGAPENWLAFAVRTANEALSAGGGNIIADKNKTKYAKDKR